MFSVKFPSGSFQVMARILPSSHWTRTGILIPLDITRHRSRFDVDFVGSQMPPPQAVKAGKVSALTDEDKRTIARWIDLGCPIELEGAGYFVDENRPTLTMTYPHAGANESLERIVIGMHDAYTGLVTDSFDVTADLAIDGIPSGKNLVSRFQNTSSGVWELKLNQPLRNLDRGVLQVSVKDRQGNISKVTRSFSVRSRLAGK